MHVARQPSRQRGCIQSLHLALTSAHSAGITDPVLMLTKAHSVTFGQKSSISLCQEGYSQQHSQCPTLRERAGRLAQGDVSTRSIKYSACCISIFCRQNTALFIHGGTELMRVMKAEKSAAKIVWLCRKREVAQTKLAKPKRGPFFRTLRLSLCQLF